MPLGSYDANIEPLKDDVLFADGQVLLDAFDALCRRIYIKARLGKQANAIRDQVNLEDQKGTHHEDRPLGPERQVDDFGLDTTKNDDHEGTAPASLSESGKGGGVRGRVREDSGSGESPEWTVNMSVQVNPCSGHDTEDTQAPVRDISRVKSV